MRPPLEARRPVVFFANGIGDHLITLPALRALAALFDGRVRLVCMNGARATFFSELALAEAIEVDMWSEGGTRHFDGDALADRIGDCDLLLSLNPWHSSSVDRLLERVAPRLSLGFFAQFDVALARNYEKHSAALAFDVPLRLAAGLRLQSFSGPPRWPADALCAAIAVRDEVPADMRVLVIHADTKPEKMWPIERWIELLDVVLAQRDDLFVLVVGQKPLPLDAGCLGERVAPCFGLSLPASLALAGLADMFIGVDSCVLHAVDLAGVPGVGLFGPTNPDEFGFCFAPHQHVHGHGQMSAVCLSAVLAAFHQLTDASRRGTASARRG